MDFAGLSSILWRERDVLENLLYKLDVQQLLLMAGRSTWLVRASAEIEQVLEQVGQIELERAVVFDAIAADMGLESGPSLTTIAAQAPEPWRTLLQEHYRAFLELAAKIQGVTALNRELAASGQEAADAVMAGIRGTEDSGLNIYAPSGETENRSRAAAFVDEAL
jgi:hypothetical protein